MIERVSAARPFQATAGKCTFAVSFSLRQESAVEQRKLETALTVCASHLGSFLVELAANKPTSCCSDAINSIHRGPPTRHWERRRPIGRPTGRVVIVHAKVALRSARLTVHQTILSIIARWHHDRRSGAECRRNAVQRPPLTRRSRAPPLLMKSQPNDMIHSPILREKSSGRHGSFLVASFTQ